MPEPSGPTRVVTFYSYKGGVGRTMALVNTAHVLALEGWRVLMVDFDLEAPGMTHFFAKQVHRRPRHVRKDAIDLLLDAKRSLEQADQNGQRPEYPQSLADYVVPLHLPKRAEEKAPGGIPYRNGRLDLIPATLEPRGLVKEEEPPLDYMERLGELDLAGLFREGGPGHRFGDHVRKYFVSARFEAPGDVLFTLRDPIRAAYDIVLIDSRTGLNEVAGFSSLLTIHPWFRKSFRSRLPPLQAIERVADGRLREDSETLKSLLETFQLPAKPAEILRGEIAVGKLASSSLHLSFDRSIYTNLPVGFWPEPLAAVALATARGTDAIQEILAWLYLARLHYGYAWRVLLDWRYFDEVKQHPDFQAFLHQEDEVVASIEEAITRGKYPL